MDVSNGTSQFYIIVSDADQAAQSTEPAWACHKIYLDFPRYENQTSHSSDWNSLSRYSMARIFHSLCDERREPILRVVSWHRVAVRTEVC